MSKDSPNSWESLLDAVREGQTDKILAVITPILSSLIGGLVAFSSYIPAYPYVVAATILMSVACGIWLLVRIVTRTKPDGSTAESKVEPAGPSPAKGGSPFFADQENLFLKLERRSEIGEIISKLDNNARVLLLHGKTHAGKTSILFAGLAGPATAGDVKHICWRAGITDRVNSFRQALQEARIDLGSSLTDVSSINMAPVRAAEYKEDSRELGQQADKRVIIIIDQFELIHDVPEDRPLFDFLAAVSNQEHPRHLQVVVAIREEYLDSWYGLGRRYGFSADQQHPLDFLSIRAAKRALETILSAARVQVRRKALADYLTNMASESRVCPLDIGIAARVFVDRASSSGQQYLSWKRYAAAGGAFGILVEYIEKWLKSCDLSKVESRALLGALTETLVSKTNIVKPSGATVQEIIQGSALSPAIEIEEEKEKDVADCLHTLAAPGWGVLEEVRDSLGSIRYRLSSQRFVPTLRHLTQRVPPILDGLPVSNFVLEQYGWWQEKPLRDSRFLLKPSLVQQMSSRQEDLVKSDPSFAEYLRRSKAANRKPKLIIAASLILTIAAAWFAYQFAVAMVQRRHLSQWHLPPELYDRQYQLETISIDSHLIDDLRWLKSARLHELEITNSTNSANSKLASLDGIQKLAGLRTLSLDLRGSEIGNLAPLSQLSELRTLTLTLGGSKITNLADLAALKIANLKLQIRASSLRDFNDLARLSNLTDLTLDMNESQIPMITELAQIQSLRTLTLIITGSSDEDQSNADVGKAPNGKSGPPYPSLPTQIENLTLTLQDSSISELPNLGQLSTLKSVAIHLRGRSIVLQMPDLAGLAALESLVIEVQKSAIGSLPNLTQLHKLRTVELAIDGSQVKSLPNFPPQLSLLRLDSKSSDLLHLSGNDSIQTLHELELHIKNKGTAELAALNHLSHVDTLTLHADWSQIHLLPDLSSLPDLHTVKLYLSGTVSEPPSALTQLHDIHTLAVYLEGTQMQQPPDVARFRGLTSLTLNLQRSRISRLPDLNQFHELRNLDLNLNFSAIQTLGALSQLVSSHQLQNLDLHLENVTIKDFPDLTQIECLRTTLDLRNTTFASLAQVGRLGVVKDITIGSGINSLADLPPSVRALRIMW